MLNTWNMEYKYLLVNSISAQTFLRKKMYSFAIEIGAERRLP